MYVSLKINLYSFSERLKSLVSSDMNKLFTFISAESLVLVMGDTEAIAKIGNTSEAPKSSGLPKSFNTVSS